MSSKEVESIEISHSPEPLLHSDYFLKSMLSFWSVICLSPPNLYFDSVNTQTEKQKGCIMFCHLKEVISKVVNKNQRK